MEGVTSPQITPRVVVAWTADPHRQAVALAAELGHVSGRPDLSHLCPRCGSSRHGRPFVRGHRQLDVSISRSGDSGLVAVAEGARVGVDVEAVDPGRFAEVSDVLLHPRETVATPYDAAVTWVRKEALLKAWGSGLATDPRTVWLSAADAAPTVLAGPAGDHGPPAKLLDLPSPPGLVGCLAVVSTESPEVSVSGAGPAARSPRASAGRGR